MKHGPTIALVVSFTAALCIALTPPYGAEREIRRAIRAARRDPLIAAAVWDQAIASTSWQEQLRAQRRFLTEHLGVRDALPTPELRELFDGIWDFGETLFDPIERPPDEE